MFARVSAVMLLFLCVLILFTSSGLGQPGSGRGKGDKGKKGGGDPVEFFKKLANGKEYIVIADISFARLQEPLAQFAKEQGITDGKITLEKYMLFSEQRAASRAAGTDFKGPPGDFKKKSDSSSDKPAAPPERSADKGLADLKKSAEAEFRKRDENGDGKLNYSEMHPTLKRELVHWDKNQDGVIDLEEFTAYFVEHSQQVQQQQKAQAEQSAGSNGRLVIELDDLDRRPVVFRMGKLPKELPDWFEKLDTNQDGLVSLGEWREGKRTFEEFKTIDRNNDGLLSPEEVLRFQADEAGLADGTQAASGSGSTTTTGPNGRSGAPAGTWNLNFLNRGQGSGQGRPGGQGKKGWGKKSE